MFSFFIRRPIFASVISIVIVIAGLVAASVLPVSQYPQIAPPTVAITTNYPGASAETLARTVAAPIEEQLSGVEGLIYFDSSSSSNGAVSITATFEVGTDPTQATIDINNRVSQALPRLPEEVRRNGVLVQRRSTDILLVVSLTAPERAHDTLFLSNYASLNLVDELKRLPGVGDVRVFGARDYSMRIWLKPDRMAQLGVTTSDVVHAINAQNAQYPAGKIGEEPAADGQLLTYTVTARGRLVEPEQFGDIIVRAGGSSGFLRLKDIASIELGAQQYDSFTTVNGMPSVGMGVYLQTGANALEVADIVRAHMTELQGGFPDGMAYVIPFDTTRFVDASIREVLITLVEAALLVVLVVFVFLQTWRATLIPILAIPVSLIGTFAGLWMFGFSINTLTLFAMVLAIGIVVDDAIVVLENVERLMRERGLSPKDAAIEAMREVAGALVAIVLVLCAVFIPVAFLGGMAGKLYQQFAVTVAIAVTISGVVALTLTPALCALLLKPSQQTSRLFRPFDHGFAWLTRLYVGTVQLALRHGFIAGLICLVIVAAVAVLLMRIPTSLVPPEDQGSLIGSVTLPDSATLQRTVDMTERLQTRLSEQPEVRHVFMINGLDIIGGGNKTNSATTFMSLEPWSQRERTAQQLAQGVAEIGTEFREGTVVAFSPAPIRGLGRAGGFEVYVQSRAGADMAQLDQTVQQFITDLSERSELTGINSSFRSQVPQLFIEVDEAKALTLGVPVTDIYSTLQSTMGTLYVNDFNRSGRTYRVQLQAEAEFRAQPEDLTRLYVRSASGGMVPLGSLLTIERVVGPEQVVRYNGFPAAKIMGNGVAGISSGEVIRLVEEVAAATLPDGFDIAWTGQAFQEKQTGSASVAAFIFAIIMVFLILAAQYERWSLPLAVIMAVPFALFGALLAILLRSMPNDIYFQIGLIVLIGLAAKNAILIVEFAAQKQAEGMALADAALEAARLRFRPIVMTSLAFVLGVLPLVLASGAGAAARKSMGTGVFGGMLAATFIATLFVPLFFYWLARFGRQERYSASAGSKSSEEVAS